LPSFAPSPLDRSTNVENLIATGNVHMQRSGGAEAKTKIALQENVDELFCDRLEVDMATDDAGHNVPKVGRALGNVHAKRVSAQGRREIQTQERLVLSLASRALEGSASGTVQ
jgi:hypothetical protein